MSLVTAITLTMSVTEDGFDTYDDGHAYDLGRINSWLDASNFAPLKDMSDHMAGNKPPQVLLLAAGYNYFDTPAFIAVLETVAWKEPSQVVLLSTTENERTLTWRPTENKP